jgi:hypothetical protein
VSDRRSLPNQSDQLAASSRSLRNRIRFRVDPGDVPTEKAARRLCLTEAQFLERLPQLLLRGFPPADPTTGMYDLDAIDVWRRLRHSHLFERNDLTTTPAKPIHAPPREIGNVGERFREAQERRRHGRAP